MVNTVKLRYLALYGTVLKKTPNIRDIEGKIHLKK